MDFRQAAEDFQHTAKLISKSEAMARFSLFARGEPSVLIFLYIQEQQGAQVLPSDICKYTKTSSARIATVLGSLEEEGYITREIDKADRRKILVGITEKGRDKARALKAQTVAFLADILKEMGEENAKEFLRTFDLFGQAVIKILEKEKFNEKSKI